MREVFAGMVAVYDLDLFKVRCGVPRHGRVISQPHVFVDLRDLLPHPRQWILFGVAQKVGTLRSF